MSLGLHNLEVNKGAKKRKRNRVGRGNSSGHGTYSTRGLKGQRSRSGGSFGLKRLGLKMILQRIPKYKGMKSEQLFKQVVNLSSLEKHFAAGDIVNKKALFQKELIKSLRLPFKILGTGELTKKLQVFAYEFSETAKVAIEKVGGKVVVLKRDRNKGKKQVFKKAQA